MRQWNRKTDWKILVFNTFDPQTRDIYELSSQSNNSHLTQVEGNRENMWAITIQIQGTPIAVKVHTDAEVSAKSLEALEHCHTIGRTFNGQTHLKMFPLIHHGTPVHAALKMHTSLKNDLLGLLAIKELELYALTE